LTSALGIDGTFTLKMSSVSAIAKTPSLKEMTRPNCRPDS
jgi:hypothetical protein